MITNEYISVGMTFTKRFDQSFYIYIFKCNKFSFVEELAIFRLKGL